MGITRLRSPTPRQQALGALDSSWSTNRARALPAPEHSHAADAFRVLDSRRTHRHFRALPKQELSTFLWYSARSRLSYLDESGRRFESRPAPSAGGCHPYDLLVVRPRKGELTASIYEPSTHGLSELRCARTALRRFVKNISEAISPELGTILWLIAQPHRTQNHYRFPESLLWRDAGALIGVMAIVAESLRLSFCPVGATGDPHLATVMGQGRNVYGLGGVIVGGRRV
jgi:SagB-type dehydrogenase family enzyme